MATSPGPSTAFARDLAVAFAMHCDFHRLSTRQAEALVDYMAEVLREAAENRREALRGYAAELIDDEDDDDAAAGGR